MTHQPFYSRHSFRVLLAMVFLLPFAGLGARRALLTNKNDVKQWLPESYEETRVYQWFQRHFGGEEFVLLSWEGCTLDDDRLELLLDERDGSGLRFAAPDAGDAGLAQANASLIVAQPDEHILADKVLAQRADDGKLGLDLAVNRHGVESGD